MEDGGVTEKTNEPRGRKEGGRDPGAGAGVALVISGARGARALGPRCDSPSHPGGAKGPHVPRTVTSLRRSWGWKRRNQPGCGHWLLGMLVTARELQSWGFGRENKKKREI